MSKPRAYGTFVKKRDNIYRTSAYIQWGDSEKSIGACLLLNPGSATLDKELLYSLDTVGQASGWIKTEDPTMVQLISFVEKIYSENQPILGRLYIYNLFNLQNTQSQNAIDQFEELVESGEYDLEESLVTINELKDHPWILLGWGVKRESKWRNLQLIKNKWINLINESQVSAFGKKHKQRDDYYHPCPLIPTQRPLMLEDLIRLYNQKYKIQRFPVYATKCNLIVETKMVENPEDLRYEWSRSFDNPESIVNGFSHLRIKKGYKLRAYQFREGGNGNGIVWAIPKDRELPEPSECETLDWFLSPPKPDYALSDFMEAIEGDKTPLSYLQASIVFHELHEFGAMWHGVSWGRDVILPLEEKTTDNSYEWEMNENEPEIIEPHFYYNNQGNPVVVFHTINDIGMVTLNRYVHIFNKDNYTLEVERICIANAGGGIIF